MSIRFKFRSSVNFDSVDMEGRPSISVGELRSKIVRQKKLNNICQDFDLVFSDALTAHEYNDDNFQIPTGSCVIIKRVPAGSVPSAMVPLNSAENFMMKNSTIDNPIGSFPVNAEDDEFDDFGVELCPVPETASSDSDLEFDKNCIASEKANSSTPRLGCQMLEASELSEAIPRGPNHGGTAENTPQTKLELEVEEHIKLEKVANVKYPAVQNTDLPSELKCPLCNAFFKEAVMIPCCQHSFCEKCIRLVLVDKARCPKCSSSKCRVEDLLPNLSLRQAIEHFLESQILLSGPDYALHKDAPDGESGIQAKDVSCAVTVFQREPNFPYSPSATEKGSNHIVADSVLGGSASRNNSLTIGKALKSAPLSHRVKQIGGERVEYDSNAGCRSGPEVLAPVPEFQGENQPLDLPPTYVHEEADSNMKRKRGYWDNPGVIGNFMATGRHGKGDRTCYMCGSPDHFIRDCPAASSRHPMLQTGNVMFPGGLPGYSPPYWHGTQMPPVRPFANIYGNLGMMPFNAAMVPVTPFAVPSYMPSLYGGIPAASCFMRSGGMAPPVGTSTERPLSRSEFLELQDCENRRKLLKEDLERGQSFDDVDFHKLYHYNEPERSHEHKSQTERGKSANHSEDSFTRRSQRKYRHEKHMDHDIDSFDERHEKSSRSSIAGRDLRPCQSERSTSEVEDIPHISDERSEVRHKHHHRSFKKHERRRDEPDVERHIKKHHSHSESGSKPSSSGDQKKRHGEKDSSYKPRHSKYRSKPSSDEMCNDRWQMVGGSDEDYREDYHHHKRKRVH